MEKFIKKQKIPDLKEGDLVNDLFVVKFKKGLRPYTKGFSFELLLSDNSGQNIEYKYWGSNDKEEVEKIYDQIKPDSIVYIQARVSLFKDKKQLIANPPMVIEVLKREQYNEADFIKPAKKDPQLMYHQLLETIKEVENPQIKELLNNIFQDKEMEKRFKDHPGAIEIHHNWIGGLLEHTLEVLHYSRLSWEIFPQLNKDLLIAGALLHDIGKLEEIKVTSRIKGTDKGQLAGHLVLSTIFISNKCDEISMDEKLKNKLLHLIISHHGKLELGSPKEPMFPEALAIYYADELSSKIAEMLEFIEEAKLNTEDDFMFHKREGRNILLK